MNNEKIALIDSFVARRANLIYDKKLRKHCKTVNATILFSQLVYWFSKQQYKMFYKFTSPCSNGRYKEGDSWTEELGFTGREFDEAFNCIGIKMSSKEQLLESKDILSNYCFYSYHDRKSKLTWYNVNLNKVAEVMQEAYQDSNIYDKSLGFNTPDELEEVIKNIESVNSEVNGINGYVNGINPQVNTYSPTGKSYIIQNTTQKIIPLDEKFSQNENSGSREFCVNTKGDANIDSVASVTVEDKTNSNSSVSEIMGTPPAAEPNATLLQQQMQEADLTDIDKLFNEFWEEYPRDIHGKKHGNKKLAKTKFVKLVKNNTDFAKEIIENVKQMATVSELCKKENEEHRGEEFHANASIPIRRAEYYLGKEDEDFIAYKMDWWDYAIKRADSKKSLTVFANILRKESGISLTLDKNQNFSVDTTASYNPDDFKVDY